jgi:riboflavin biosynthesis pyrimidine reductase
MTICANIVMGSNGGTTISGRSSALSSPADRKRFHALRERADAIVIGGESARREPYSKTPVPLIVVTHSPELPGSCAHNPLAIMSDLDIGQTLEYHGKRYSFIVIEGGANFLRTALASGLVDELFITVAQMNGEEPYIDRSTFTSGFTLIHEESIDGDLFLHYARLPKNSL